MISWETLYTVSGGPAAPYVTGLAEALVTRGHEVHVFTRASHGLRINVEHINSVTYNEVGALLLGPFRWFQPRFRWSRWVLSGYRCPTR